MRRPDIEHARRGTGRRESDRGAGERRLGKIAVERLHAEIEIARRIPDRARADLPGRPIGAAGRHSVRRADHRVHRRAVGVIVHVGAVQRGADVRHPVVLDRRNHVPHLRQLQLGRAGGAGVGKILSRTQVGRHNTGCFRFVSDRRLEGAA